ncbi:hypothetical protein Desaci_3890 [Desulfosporosinus acidiphilus SJ4]|uniref:Single cache domain-containing protein n=1 Tax=Desulfosporosinus acidiphilus (strain DSM 22704 / JCM 16185 / SJ4) TaxID=646529 RepID=I4DAE3_DESAJ|nr:hypothetical protein Desaci_3890 [Desulfosporosinus acidiphilus SJ4]
MKEKVLKKFYIFVTIMLLMFSLAGCANKPVIPTTPQTGTSLNPQDHPAETPAQPRDKVSQANVETKTNDILNKKYPGDWKLSGNTLSKGAYTENGKFKMVDDVAALFPNTMGVSIFVGNQRISSSVIQQNTGQRVLGGYATPAAVGDVLKSGTTTSTLSSGYQNVYIPLKDSNAKTVAVMTISIPKQ